MNNKFVGYIDGEKIRRKWLKAHPRKMKNKKPKYAQEINWCKLDEVILWSSGTASQLLNKVVSLNNDCPVKSLSDIFGNNQK